MFKKFIVKPFQRVLEEPRQQSRQKSGAKATARTRLPKGEQGPEWGEPTPLAHAEPPATPYPLNCLSQGIREVVEAIARKTQAPEAIAAQSVLAVVSLTFASRTQVQTLGSTANAACFFVLAALSGERKSATDRLAMGGVNRTVLELRQEHAQQLKEHEEIIGSDGPKGGRPPVPVHCLTEWHDTALLAAESALSERERDEGIARLRAKVSEITMAKELALCVFPECLRPTGTS